MGQGLLDVQVEKIESQHPKPNESVSHILDFLKDDQHKMIAAESNGWMHKPNANIYEEFFKKNVDYNNGIETGVQNNRDCSDARIFVDDKEINCRAALENGFDIAIICNDQRKIKPTLQALGVTGLEEKQQTA